MNAPFSPAKPEVGYFEFALPIRGSQFCEPHQPFPHATLCQLEDPL